MTDEELNKILFETAKEHGLDHLSGGDVEVEKKEHVWSSRRAASLYGLKKSITATASPLNVEDLDGKLEKVCDIMEKSEDSAIPTWGVVEKFKSFIKGIVPSLTGDEANRFSKMFKIFKIKEAERNLKDISDQ